MIYLSLLIGIFYRCEVLAPALRADLAGDYFAAVGRIELETYLAALNAIRMCPILGDVLGHLIFVGLRKAVKSPSYEDDCQYSR